MTFLIEFTEAEVEALAGVVGEAVEVDDPTDVLLTAFLKLIRVLADRQAPRPTQPQPDLPRARAITETGAGFPSERAADFDLARELGW